MNFFKAGIPGKQIRLALEPEVASIYAKEVYLERSRNMVQQPNASFGQGTKFIVLDLGGTCNLMYNQIHKLFIKKILFLVVVYYFLEAICFTLLISFSSF